MLLRKKNSLLIPSGSAKHLFVVVSDVCPDGCHLLVNFSTIREGVYYDTACEVKTGEHPFIKSPSYIAYSYAKIERADDLIARVKSSFFILQEDVSEGLFDRICRGIIKSSHISKMKKEYYKKVTSGPT
jgi:hypothetical protein